VTRAARASEARRERRGERVGAIMVSSEEMMAKVGRFDAKEREK
jgi:hypothetical protein